MIAIDIQMPIGCSSCACVNIEKSCCRIVNFGDISGFRNSRPERCPLHETKLHKKGKRVDLWETEKIKVRFWEEMTGAVTPGGDPAWICPACHSKDSRHVWGIENLDEAKDVCPTCGVKLQYS